MSVTTNVTLRRLFLTNPLLEEATRAWRKFFRVAGGPGKGVSYLVVGIIALIYLWLLAEIVVYQGDLSDMLLFVQLTVVTLVMPTSVYGAISGERERTTWEALILTRLTPGQIVAGKVLWRVVTLLILMAVFLVPILVSRLVADPASSGSANRSAGVFVLEELMTFLWGLGLCAYGLWVSANTRRSVTSIALIFVSLLGVLALLPALFSILMPGSDMADFGGNYGMWLIMHINPFYALTQMLSSQRYPYSEDMGPSLGFGAWGGFQAVIYAIGTVVFLYATYRSLRIYEEPKSRIG